MLLFQINYFEPCDMGLDFKDLYFLLIDFCVCPKLCASVLCSIEEIMILKFLSRLFFGLFGLFRCVFLFVFVFFLKAI